MSRSGHEASIQKKTRWTRQSGGARLPACTPGSQEEVTISRPIIHIGYHKTATTWFQTSVYPASTSHRWIPRRQVWRALLDPPGTYFDPQEARRILDEGDDGRPIAICEENLSGYIHNGGLHGFLAPAVARRIKSALPDAQIVMYVRSQPSMIAACYAQYVKGGGTHSLERYLFPERFARGAQAKRFKIPRFAFEHFEYDRLVSIYDAHFGRPNVRVYAYEDMCDPARQLRRMSEELRIAFDWDRISFRRRNPSWNASLFPLARFLNRFTARTVEDKNFIVHLPTWYAVRSGLLHVLSRLLSSRDSSFKLPGEHAAWVERLYAESNRRLVELRPELKAAYLRREEEPGRPVEEPVLAAALAPSAAVKSR